MTFYNAFDMKTAKTGTAVTIRGMTHHLKFCNIEFSGKWFTIIFNNDLIKIFICCFSQYSDIDEIIGLAWSILEPMFDRIFDQSFEEHFDLIFISHDLSLIPLDRNRTIIVSK